MVFNTRTSNREITSLRNFAAGRFELAVCRVYISTWNEVVIFLSSCIYNRMYFQLLLSSIFYNSAFSTSVVFKIVDLESNIRIVRNYSLVTLQTECVLFCQAEMFIAVWKQPPCSCCCAHEAKHTAKTTNVIKRGLLIHDVSFPSKFIIC